MTAPEQIRNRNKDKGLPKKSKGPGAPQSKRAKPGKDYNMKYAEMVEKAVEMIRDDDELMMNLVDELDNWNGYADGFRCYDMYELDDFLSKLASDFDLRDDFFYDTIYGISSTSDKAELYRDNTDAGDIFDNVLENLSHLYIDDSDFADLMSEIDNYTDEDDEKTA